MPSVYSGSAEAAAEPICATKPFNDTNPGAQGMAKRKPELFVKRVHDQTGLDIYQQVTAITKNCNFCRLPYCGAQPTTEEHLYDTVKLSAQTAAIFFGIAAQRQEVGGAYVITMLKHLALCLPYRLYRDSTAFLA